MNGKSTVIGIITVLLIVGGIYFVVKKSGTSIIPVTKKVAEQTPPEQATPVEFKGQKQVVVSIKNNAFSPQKIKIDPGTVVVFRNEDQTAHTVDINPNEASSFTAKKSGMLESGQEYSFVFEKAGQYSYYCSLHQDSGMSGEISVE